jgi:hypothetical protein
MRTLILIIALLSTAFAPAPLPRHKFKVGEKVVCQIYLLYPTWMNCTVYKTNPDGTYTVEYFYARTSEFEYFNVEERDMTIIKD